MKKMKRIKLKRFITLGFLLLSTLISTASYAARGEEGGIGGTGFEDSEERLLRPEIPSQGIRPEIFVAPRPPVRIERPSAIEHAPELFAVPDIERPEAPAASILLPNK